MRTLTAVFLGLGALPAAAGDLVFGPEATEACLRSGQGAACIGASANMCMEVTPGGGSTAGMGGCLDRELQYWDARLNAAYTVAMRRARAVDAEMKDLGSSAPPQAPAMRAMQRAWIGFRDAKCDFVRSEWGGGTGGGPATIACLMEETGRQALFLERRAEGN